GIHDLVGFTLLQDTVLVNAGAVSEGVFADDRFAPGDMQTAHSADDARGLQNLASGDVGPQVRKVFAAGFDGHHHLFEGAIARAFTNAVERALHLTGSSLHRRQRVGDRQAQIIVAMHTDHGLVDVFHVCTEIGDQGAVLFRDGVADGIRNIYRGGSGIYGRLHNLGQELGLG